MHALLLRLEAPMQSWGTQSRFSERDTQLEPSKSGVLGILAAALGRPRSADLSDLAALQVAVRVDREGRKLRDYHTTGGGEIPAERLLEYGVKKYGVSRAGGGTPDTALSNRYYLSDASFLVAVGSADRVFLEQIAEALRSPVFPIFFGRKSFVPHRTLLEDWDNPIREGKDLREILCRERWHFLCGEAWLEGKLPRWLLRRKPHEKEVPDKLRLILEDSGDITSTRHDHPLDTRKGHRQFRERTVSITFIPNPPPVSPEATT